MASGEGIRNFLDDDAGRRLLRGIDRFRKMVIKALPLNGNKSLNRWRFVVKDTEGSMLWSSLYSYTSEATALEAGNAKALALKKKSNPVNAKISQANRRYSSFMQRGPSKQEIRTVPALPKVALAIGEVVELHYASDRDGKRFIYRHVFKSGSRPLLASSHDGKQLILLGGAFRFTRRGIVDK